MTAAFLRLAFIAACSAYLLGLVLVAHWLGDGVAIVVGAIGTVFAALLAEDWSTPPAQEPERTTGRRLRRVPLAGHDDLA